MKSDLIGPKRQKKESKYPYLGIHLEKGRVVLFTEKNTGLCVHEAQPEYGVGDYDDEWNESAFEPLEGKIVLEND